MYAQSCYFTYVNSIRTIITFISIIIIFIAEANMGGNQICV